MKIDILTLFPEMFAPLRTSIIGRAVANGKAEINVVDIRDYTLDKHKKCDDTPFGGGAGMVLAPQPYVDAYEAINKESNSITVMMTPQGEPFTHEISKELAKYNQVIILCGHYEGYDERIREIIKPREISIGDFVLTGGELPALCVIDSVSRNIEGTLGKIESAHDDSFADGLLEYPQYTKPREYRGLCVPDVLVSGNHKLIEEFRMNEKISRTKAKRPDLYEKWKNKNF